MSYRRWRRCAAATPRSSCLGTPESARRCRSAEPGTGSSPPGLTPCTSVEKQRTQVTFLYLGLKSNTRWNGSVDWTKSKCALNNSMQSFLNALVFTFANAAIFSDFCLSRNNMRNVLAKCGIAGNKAKCGISRTIAGRLTR